MDKFNEKQSKMPVFNTLFFAKSKSDNFANENTLAYQDENELHRIKQKNERITYRQRLFPLKRFTLLALLLLLLLSALTESSFLIAGFMGMSSSWRISIFLTLLLVLIIELSKFYLGAYVLRFIVGGWLSENWRYFIAFSILLPMMCAVFYGSYTMSVQGAPRIATFITEQTEIIPIVDTDSIQTHYDEKIAPLLDAQADARKTKWRGVTTNTASELTRSYQEQINLLEEQRKSAIDLANLQNQSLIQTSKLNTIDWGKWLSRFGGYGEILTLFFLLFLEFYDRASYLELPNPTAETTVEEPIKTNLSSSFVSQKNGREFTESPPRKPQSQPILPTPTNDKSNMVVVGKVKYEDKLYDESRFRDWMKKAKYRSENNATEESRKSNRLRYLSLKETWEKHTAKYHNGVEV